MLFIVSEEEDKKESKKSDNLDEELENQWALQDQIHHKCKMRDDPKLKQKEWDEKHE